jgi:hypothetical protein
MHSFIVTVFLLGNIIAMTICSFLCIVKKMTEKAVAGLFVVVIVQGIGYGLLFTPNFLFRNMSIVGGLLMLLADFYSSSRKPIFAGLPTLNETDKATYMQLFGRILLVFLFMNSMLGGEYSLLRVIVSIIGFFGCVCVVVGFKAKYSAWMLIAFLTISNIILNDFWNTHP